MTATPRERLLEALAAAAGPLSASAAARRSSLSYGSALAILHAYPVFTHEHQG